MDTFHYTRGGSDIGFDGSAERACSGEDYEGQVCIILYLPFHVCPHPEMLAVEDPFAVAHQVICAVF